MIRPALAFVLVLVARGVAAEPSDDPCADAIGDPAATPIRDIAFDDQRSACLRSELGASVNTHALIDTPGFHGLVGGDLALAARAVPREGLELGARLRVVDYTFVQSGVNKVTKARYGPLVLGVALGARISDRAHGALVLAGEVPSTRDDNETMHTGGELTAVLTGALGPRMLLHGRIGAVAALAWSEGGETRRIGFRAGANLAWRLRRGVTLLGGAESQAGFNGGFDTLMVRTGLNFRASQTWRGVLGIGVPLGGNEQTNAVVELGVTRDFE